MKPVSSQSKSFIVLFCVAVLGTYLAMLYSDKTDKRELEQLNALNNMRQPDVKAAEKPTKQVPEVTVDTANWKQYQDPKYNFSFKINPAWKVSAKQQKDGTYVLEVDPGAKYYNMKVYITSTGFFALEGLPTQETTIANQPAVAVQDLLYGVKRDNTYFTFDLGSSLSLRPQFKAMVHSLQFE